MITSLEVYGKHHSHFHQMKWTVHTNSGALPLVPNTTIWKKESDNLGERQDTTRMPTRLGGSFFG